MQTYKIAIIGLGTVGLSVAQILNKHKHLIAQRSGIEIVVAKVLVRNQAKYAHYGFNLAESLDEILEDESIALVVELVGGIEYPFEIAKRVFQKKKAFVSANKAMIASKMQELVEYSKGIPFGFEASVCGGIPIVEAFRDSLVGNAILDFSGIMNGTSNFILTQMEEKNQSFQSALTQAQELGYAEADPTLDIEGGDAAHKLLILAKLAYGIVVKEEEILIEGIKDIELEDIMIASKLGYKIKLLGIARKEGEFVELRVHPTFIPHDSMLCSANGVKNALSVRGDGIGEMLYCGLGAGGDATASAVIADIVNIARLRECAQYPIPPFGTFNSSECVKLKNKGDIICQFYLKIEVLHQSGAMAKLTSILAECEISISQLMQEDNQRSAIIILLTHRVEERKVNEAIKKISLCSFTLGSIRKIRVHE
ncbi:homoserine dehydrogenase [Helicobacter cholecystus]|uniref:Homoserine dehydrogenase n=1 Tax=Helicobacter cholecystus TaxID=45498 RepID=A0A3D8IVD5_9HELI|nr:homoserine dehydrogenase [Helicobacter cholecystus]RDU69239.1 homoserine dehydrogenase [Helicobacter cholecystus]